MIDNSKFGWKKILVVSALSILAALAISFFCYVAGGGSESMWTTILGPR